MARLSAICQPARSQATNNLRTSAAGRSAALPKVVLSSRPHTALRCAAPPIELHLELQQATASTPCLLPRPAHKASQVTHMYTDEKYVKLCQFIEVNSVVQLPDSQAAEAAIKISRVPECLPPQQQSWWQLSFDEDHGLVTC